VGARWPALTQRVLTVSPRTETDSLNPPPIQVLSVNVASPFQVLIENGAEQPAQTTNAKPLTLAE
jgi:hypothetical protein